MEYNSEIIEQHARGLYSEADWVVYKYSFIGIVVGGVAGAIVGRFEGGSMGVFGLVGAVIGYLIWYSMGSSRAFQYRLQAQMALCQVKIERNTRGVGPASVNDTPTQESKSSTPVAPNVEAKPGQMGRCPNCETIIPLNARECRKCTAQFGGTNLWAVKPL